MDDAFAALADLHDGLFTRAQAVDVGSSDRELCSAVRRGYLHRLRHGCYTIANSYAVRDEVSQHLLLARAVIGSQLGGVALTGPSAAALHGLSTYGLDLSIVHLVRLDRGSSRARAAVRLADGRAESPGESLSRVLFHLRGVPKPELQHKIYDRDGVLVAVTDFYWEDFCHVGEFDGKEKYSKYLRPGESPADAVFREKRREDVVRGRQLGMTRWAWLDVMANHAPDLLRRLTEDLHRSRWLYGRRSA